MVRVNLNDPLVERMLVVLEGERQCDARQAVARLDEFVHTFCYDREDKVRFLASSQDVAVQSREET